MRLLVLRQWLLCIRDGDMQAQGALEVLKQGGRITGAQTARDATIVAGVKTGGGTDSVSPPARDDS